MRRALAVMSLLLLMGAGCKSSAPLSNMEPQNITLETSDHVTLAAMYRYSNEKNVAILLHMMPATKESWGVFAQKLTHAGIASLAIDERGHGESTMNGTLNYKQFTDDQHRAKIHDVEAAYDYLKSQGFDDTHIFVIGASIGANLTIEFLSQHPSIPAAIALSPGLDYHGVTTADSVKKVSSNQRLMIVTSDDDPESAMDSKSLHSLNPNTVLIEKHGLGHGTNMFVRDPSLMQLLIKQLQS